MLELSTQDLQDLAALLKDLPELATEQSRWQVLELAGLRQLRSMLDVSGPPFMAVVRIVSYLANYGRLSYDHEALGLFLNLVKSLVGVEQRDYLDAILNKYNMMAPVASTPAPGEWRGKEDFGGLYEKIVGENTLRPVAFLSQGIRVSRTVAYIGVHAGIQRWSGTGFLVSRALLLTCYHVIPDPNLLPGVIVRFNYQESFTGEAQKLKEYRPKPGGLFHSNAELDFALVELDGTPGKTWGALPLQPLGVKRDDRVNIIQHPAGQPKHISIQNNFVEYVDDTLVQYVTATLPGSSGAPVFNDNWNVVALHHAGGNMREPATRRTYFRNEGILISFILRNLPPDVIELLKPPALA
ncbi:MAG: trypsin-like peptidase domain-containing protein [Anaerolineales bacterium]|nr:trypsin-like peptidase domain-containing protein [Anaerolineales bacterium]